MWVRHATRLVKVFGRSAVVPSNRLPLRVAPAPGEAIDSWLEVTARYMDLPLRPVARVLDLPSLRDQPGLDGSRVASSTSYRQPRGCHRALLKPSL